MASLSVWSGVPVAGPIIPESQLIIFGAPSVLKSIPYAFVANLFGGLVSEQLFGKAQERLSEGPVPVYLDLFHLVGIPSRCSHHGSPARGDAVVSYLTSLLGSRASVTIIACVPEEYTVAVARSVARTLPLYSRRTKTKEGDPAVVKLHIVLPQGSLCDADVTYLDTLCVGVRECAKLVDMPCNELNTDNMVDAARLVASQLGPPVAIDVIKGTDLLNQGFGGIYHVGKAASFPPAFVVLSYCPPNATDAYAIVGKGIVYDTGGTQLKTKTGMPGMKRDMGGSAGVLHSFATLVKGGFQQKLYCLLCLAENMIGKEATKPDDVIQLLSGKQIEINNTDAEGRLVLADGVYYAYTKLKCTTIIDMATLTGAQAIATGVYHAAIVTNQYNWEGLCTAAGRASGDLTHPLPFYPELHMRELTSAIADYKNSTLGKTDAGSAVAALFIGVQINFDSSINWLHIDMAAPVKNGERATGYGVALLNVLLGSLTNVPILKKLAPKLA